MRRIVLALCLVLVSADADDRQQPPPDLPRIDASPNEFDMTGVLWDFNEGRFLLECRMIGRQYAFTDKRVYAGVGHLHQAGDARDLHEQQHLSVHLQRTSSEIRFRSAAPGMAGRLCDQPRR